MKKGKTAILLLLTAAVGAGGWFGYQRWENKKEEKTDAQVVYMEQVGTVCEGGPVGVVSRFVGVVDTQETKEIRLDSDKSVKEVFVREGDTVKKGDPLFSYDTDEMGRKLAEEKLELEEMRYSLDNMNAQLASLQANLAKAKPEDAQGIQLEILTAQNQISRQQYTISVKELEISGMEGSLENAVVYADMEGIVQSLNNAQGGYDSSGAFITLLATGDYRVKGTCNEMTVSSLSVGEPMFIRPRSNEKLEYAGVVTKINTEPAKDDSQNTYSPESGEGSKYTFYVALNQKTDLLLGQHVIMEPDIGQEKAREGLWLPSYYISYEDDGPVVWTCSEKNTAVRTRVEVGETDDAQMKCEILSGLTEKDYIAFPDESIVEGSKVRKLEEI